MATTHEPLDGNPDYERGYDDGFADGVNDAAPGVLAALKECALQLAQIHNRRLTPGEQSALDNARAAINAAEGKAND